MCTFSKPKLTTNVNKSLLSPMVMEVLVVVVVMVVVGVMVVVVGVCRAVNLSPGPHPSVC